MTALQSLTRIAFRSGQGPRFFDHQLVQLPRLQSIVHDSVPCRDGACLWLSRLPADMGSLTSTLRHLNLCRNGLTHFPPALCQRVALEHLDADGNNFAVLPAAITALSRLTELVLGRRPAVQKRPCGSFFPEARALDVRVLGDLSASPALRILSFHKCEVTLCESVLGAVRHASLASIAFELSHPAPGCALAALQLAQALSQLGRGRVLRFAVPRRYGQYVEQELQSAQALPPIYRLKVALQLCGLES